MILQLEGNILLKLDSTKEEALPVYLLSLPSLAASCIRLRSTGACPVARYLPGTREWDEGTLFLSSSPLPSRHTVLAKIRRHTWGPGSTEQSKPPEIKVHRDVRRWLRSASYGQASRRPTWRQKHKQQQSSWAKVQTRGKQPKSRGKSKGPKDWCPDGVGGLCNLRGGCEPQWGPDLPSSVEKKKKNGQH